MPMKCSMLTLGFAMSFAAPLTAQWLGMPAWNSAKGGTGVTFYGDYGAPNDSALSGHAFGGRAALGSGTIRLSAGGASSKPGGQNAPATTNCGTPPIHLIGASLIPISANLQFGA